MVTKKLPKDEVEIEKLAQAWQLRQKKKREEAARTEAQKLQAILEKGESKAALEAALAIVRKQKPDILKL